MLFIVSNIQIMLIIHNIIVKYYSKKHLINIYYVKEMYTTFTYFLQQIVALHMQVN